MYMPITAWGYISRGSMVLTGKWHQYGWIAYALYKEYKKRRIIWMEIKSEKIVPVSRIHDRALLSRTKESTQPRIGEISAREVVVPDGCGKELDGGRRR
jgi:hypothetical protein